MIAALLRARERERIRFRGARTRSPVDIRVLRGPAVSFAGPMGGPLDFESNIRRPPRYSAICRRPGGARPEARHDPRRIAAKRSAAQHMLDVVPRQRRAPSGCYRAASTRRTAKAFTGGAPRRLTYAQSRPHGLGYRGSACCDIRDCRRMSLSRSSCRTDADSVLALLGVAACREWWRRRCRCCGGAPIASRLCRASEPRR